VGALAHSRVIEWQIAWTAGASSFRLRRSASHWRS